MFSSITIKINTLPEEHKIENLPALILNHQRNINDTENINIQNTTRIYNPYNCNRTNLVNLATKNDQARCVNVLESGELNLMNLTQIDLYINYTNKPFKKDF